jgi:hypothetical protein
MLRRASFLAAAASDEEAAAWAPAQADASRTGVLAVTCAGAGSRQAAALPACVCMYWTSKARDNLAQRHRSGRPTCRGEDTKTHWFAFL